MHIVLGHDPGALYTLYKDIVMTINSVLTVLTRREINLVGAETLHNVQININ